MKWPVSVELVESRLDGERARYADLLEKYHALKGGAEPVHIEVRDDPVRDAILAKAHGNPLLFRHFQSFVADQRAIGMSEDLIASAILHGQDDDGILA